MLQPVVIMLKRIACIIRRVYRGTLYCPRKFLFKGFQCKEVVAEDKHVFTVLRAIRLFRVFNQYARFQLRLVILAYPSKFEFLEFCHIMILLPSTSNKYNR